jgi:hypothetical protein
MSISDFPKLKKNLNQCLLNAKSLSTNSPWMECSSIQTLEFRSRGHRLMHLMVFFKVCGKVFSRIIGPQRAISWGMLVLILVFLG